MLNLFNIFLSFSLGNLVNGFLHISALRVDEDYVKSNSDGRRNALNVSVVVYIVYFRVGKCCIVYFGVGIIGR